MIRRGYAWPTNISTLINHNYKREINHGARLVLVVILAKATRNPATIRQTRDLADEQASNRQTDNTSVAAFSP
jgi:hypothetical protein